MSTTRYKRGPAPAKSARPSGREAGEAVRYVPVTEPCGVCGGPLPAGTGRRWCSDRCRQAAFRARQAAPRPPQPAKADIVYECPTCEARYLGQRCQDCNTFCRRLGPGPEQLAPPPPREGSRSSQTKERA